MAFKSPLDQAKVLTLTNPTDVNASAPIIEQKPQRFSSVPLRENYNIDNALYDKLRDYEYYNRIEDFDKDIKHYQDRLADSKDSWNSDYYTQRLELLQNPNIQKYVRDRNAYYKQFDNDANEYYPTARDAIIKKLLGEGDIYKTHKYLNAEGQRVREDYDDLYDAINQEFAKKYGYESPHYFDMFSPLRFKRHGLYSPLGNEEDIEGGYRQKYNKNEYIGELLRSGELTLDELRQYLLGGK